MYFLLIFVLSSFNFLEIFASQDVISTNETLTKYYLWTRDNPSTHQELTFADVDSLLNSNFDSGRKTKVLVHGYTGFGTQGWVLRMKGKFLEKGDDTLS